MVNRNILLAFLFALTICNSIAQEKTLLLQHLTSKDGLSDNQVTCVLRDKLGFIWIGTRDGLNRYDGREFFAFRNMENDPASVCGNNITCLCLDDDSLLWIGTASSGFCSYNFRNGKFKSYNKDNSSLVSNSVNDIAFDKNRNCLWVGLTNSGLQIFDLAVQSLLENNISKNTYYDILLIDTIPYFAGINESLKRLRTIGKNKTIVSDTARTINTIFKGSDGHIWCGAWDNGLHEFDKTTRRLNTYFFDGTNKMNVSGNEIIALAEDTNKQLWCGTKTSGILFFDLKTKSFSQAYKLPGINSQRINCLYEDNCNRIWIGTETGLFVFNLLNNQFMNTKLPVPSNSGRCKVYDRLVLYSGTELLVSECGLFYKNINQKEYQHQDLIYRNEKQQLFSIFRDSKNRIFIGTNKSILLFDTLKMTLANVPCSKEVSGHWFHSITSSRVNSIVQYNRKSDTIIVASLYGHVLHIVHPDKKNIFRMIYIKKDSKDYFDNLTRKLFIDSKNNFWACGASQGISQLFIPDSILFNNFSSSEPIIPDILFPHRTWGNKKFTNSPIINDVYDIAENSDGSYWLTTQGQGLLKFFPDDKSQPFVSFANDIKSLQGLAKVGEDNLWMISSTGLINYNTKTNRYKLYDSKNGIAEIVSGYFFQTQSQNLIAGYDGGYISFNPNNIIEDKEKPDVSVTRLWIMDIESDSLLHSKINLNFDKNFLKFYVSANCFSNNEQLTFKYFLEGIDNDWRNNQNNPVIAYTNLPHGDFTLKVKAINSDGVESDVMSLPVIITPPFYQTIYFYVTVILMLSGTVYTFYRYRIKQILKLQEVRSKIARDLHDDIGSTLGSIHLYSQIANKKLSGAKSEEIKSILEKIENSSSEIIDKTGDVVWAAKASNDTLRSLILRMEGYAASLLGAAGIQFTFNYEERIVDTKLEMNKRKNIFLIYKEAIHNIIKYAHCTKVTISIQKEAEHIQVSISDDGKGFMSDNMSPYNGNGIKNMKARAEEIKGSFIITSQPLNGTTVLITI